MKIRALSGFGIVTLILFFLSLGYKSWLFFWSFLSVLALLEGVFLCKKSCEGLNRFWYLPFFLWTCSLPLLFFIENTDLLLLRFFAFYVFIYFVFQMLSSVLSSTQKNRFFQNTSTGFFVLFWISACSCAHFLICFQAKSVLPPLFLFLVMWLQDTFAYFGGMLFGKTRLCESLSPKKTWEGSVIGVLVAVLCLLPFSSYFGFQTNYSFGVVVFAVAIAGQLGDLFESWVKRVADEKDSGKLFPGHGGILDRFDSVLFASLVYLVFL